MGLLLKRNHAIKNPPTHILIIKMMGIGSLLVASDSIYSIKKRYPNSKLILFCGKGVRPAIAPLHLFDEIFESDDSNFVLLLRSGFNTLFKCWKFKKLWVVDLEVYSVLTTIFSAATMGINRFGFELNKVHFRNYLNTHNVYFNQFISVYRNYENIAKEMGVIDFSNFTIPVKITKNEKKFIAINNTCSELGGHLRKIPDLKLFKICNYILSKSDLDIAFTGATVDFAEINVFIKNYFGINKRITNIAGKFEFADYYSFLKNQCKFMITIDSAPFHIAIKTDVPTISLWGPINPKQRYNFESGKKHKFYYLNLDCSPCIHQTEVIPCYGNNICMNNMDELIIYNMIDELIN
jgi:ADP-heptose:LPS heptosyltransferase